MHAIDSYTFIERMPTICRKKVSAQSFSTKKKGKHSPLQLPAKLRSCPLQLNVHYRSSITAYCRFVPERHDAIALSEIPYLQHFRHNRKARHFCFCEMMKSRGERSVRIKGHTRSRREQQKIKIKTHTHTRAPKEMCPLSTDGVALRSHAP